MGRMTGLRVDVARERPGADSAAQGGGPARREGRPGNAMPRPSATTEPDRKGGPLASFLLNLLVFGAIIALIAAAWLISIGALSSGLGAVKRHALYIACLGAALMALAPARGTPWRRSLVLLPPIAALCAVVVADAAFLRFFKVPFFEIYPHLPVTATNVTARALAGYASAYLSFDIVAVGAALFAGTLLVGRFKEIGKGTHLAASILPVLLVAAAGSIGGNRAGAAMALGDVMNEPPVAARRLEAVDRSTAIAPNGAPLHEPRTILFVVLESAGRTIPASDGATPLRDRIARLGGSAGWIDFGNAVTNSNATDVSVPSMLTGAGAHEGLDKLHALPFVTDLAAARGYRTALVTSSTLNWAGFDRFFAGARLDDKMHAESFGRPFVNDLTIDDHFAFGAAADLVERHAGKLFVALYANALHWPFQTESEAGVPEDLSDRRSRAAHIQETGFASLFDALRRTNRLDDALVVVVGDHGEFDFSARAHVPITRVQTFEEGILSPVFLLKAPSGLPAGPAANLRANADRLVAPFDLAPTLAHLLGVTLAGGLRYEGASLLDPVPPERAVFSTATNEWRSWTKASVAVSRGRERMTCEADELCQLGVETGGGLKRVRQATPQDPLFLLALSDPLMRKNIGKIYRDHLGIR